MNLFFLFALIAILLTTTTGLAQINILTPSASDTLRYNFRRSIRATYDITWSGSQPSDTFVLQYSVNGGRNYRTINEWVFSTAFRWEIPHDYTDSALLRLVRARTFHSTLMGTTSQPPIRTPMALRPGGGFVATSSSPSGPRHPSLWSLQSGTPVALFDSSYGKVESFAFSPTGDTLAISSRPWDRSLPWIRFYDLRTNALVQSFRVDDVAEDRNQTSPIILYRSTGDRIEVLSKDFWVRSYSIATGELISRTRHQTGHATCGAFSKDGSVLVLGSSDSKVRIYATDSMKVRRTISDVGEPIRDVAFSLDDSLLAIAGDNGLVTIRKSTTGEKVASFTPHLESTLSVTFSPDGRYLLTTGGDKMGRVWEWRTQALVALLVGHTDSVSHGDFTPDGRQVVTSSFDGTTRLWTLNPAPLGDTSDGMFSIRHFRPEIPDTITLRVAYEYPMPEIEVARIGICNSADYPLTITKVFNSDTTGPYYVHSSLLEGKRLPLEIKIDKCDSIIWTLQAYQPTIDTGHYAIVLSGDTLLVYFRIEVYLPATAPHIGTGAGTMALRAVPNPAAQSTRLDLLVTEPGTAEVIVTDVIGNRVRSIDLGRQIPGSRSVEVDLSDLPTGLYQATFRSAGKSVSTMLHIVR